MKTVAGSSSYDSIPTTIFICLTIHFFSDAKLGLYDFAIESTHEIYYVAAFTMGGGYDLF